MCPIYPNDDSSSPQLLQRVAETGLSAKYEIGFEAPLGIVNKRPLHETIAIAAFIRSKVHFPVGVKYDNLTQKQWEFIRGLIWNDDPSCLLLNNSYGNNHDFGIGYDWYDAFIHGPDNCMTKRSHFGDLQFLHAMATKAGEQAETTKQHLMEWLEIMYKLACGDQGISPTDQLASKFPSHFDNSTTPNGSATLRELILATTPSYGWVNLERRALGICLHIVQDSYTIGHAQRLLLNPQDLAPRDQQGFIQFKPNTFGNYGGILAFHSYAGQNEGRHGHYDKIPEGLPLPVPKDLNSFNSLLGARNAIDASETLIEHFATKTKWDDGVRQFLSDQVFALDEHVQPANTDVDQGSLSISVSHYQPKTAEQARKQGKLALLDRSHGCEELEDSYIVGMARKLNRLESGLGSGPADTESPLLGIGTYGWARQSWLMTLIIKGATVLVISLVAALSLYTIAASRVRALSL